MMRILKNELYYLWKRQYNQILSYFNEHFQEIMEMEHESALHASESAIGVPFEEVWIKLWNKLRMIIIMK